MNVLDRKMLVATAVALTLSGAAHANPEGGKVIAGAMSSTSSTSSLNLQVANGTIVDWKSFSIGAGERTSITLENSSGRMLNRVTGLSSSQIDGALSSNGSIYLVNTNGIVVGGGARIDVNNLVLSGLNVSNDDFTSGGPLTFGGGGGSVTNNGTIVSGAKKGGGFVALMGSTVTNSASGQIYSSNGDIVLAAGQKIKLASLDASNVFIEISAPENKALNLGTVDAPNSIVALLGGSVEDMGDIKSKELVLKDDEIVDGGGDDGEMTPPLTDGGSNPIDPDSPTVNPDTSTNNPPVREPDTEDPALRDDPNLQNPNTQNPVVPPVIVDNGDDVTPGIVIDPLAPPRTPSFITDQVEEILVAGIITDSTTEIVRLQETVDTEIQEKTASVTTDQTSSTSSGALQCQ